MLWPGAHVGSPASIKLLDTKLNKKLCTKFRLSLFSVYFLKKYRKCIVWSMATKRLVEKYHFCENKVACKSIRVHICNSWVSHLFSTKFLPSFVIFWCYDKTFWSKATCGGKGSFPNQTLRRVRAGTWRPKGMQKPSRNATYWLAQFVFLYNPGHPAQGWHCPSFPMHRLGPPIENHSSRKRPTSMPTGQSHGGNSSKEVPLPRLV